MLKRIRSLGRSTAAYLKTPEIVYSLALIILIPTLIAANSITLVNLFTRLADAQAKDKAAATAHLLKHSLDGLDENEAQEKIEEIADTTADLDGRPYFLQLEYFIKSPDSEAFVVAAASNPERVGTTIVPAADTAPNERIDPRTFTQLNLSWTERRDIAVAAVFEGTSGYQVSVLADDARSQERRAVIYAFVSTEHIDRLLTEAYIKSAALLTVSVAITLLLLFIRSRIYRYSTLFRQLKQIDEMKDEFISIASHELRTPLTSIRGNLSMLLEEHDLAENEKHRMLTSAERSAEELTQLVADLLDVSRIEQGRIKLQPAPIDASPAIEDVVERLRVQAEAKHIQLSFKKPDEKVMVRADQDKLRQILTNLIGNAVKYTNQGSVTISLDAEGDFVAFDIRDTGIGMAPQDRAELFKKFYRIRNHQTANISGTGLGLWITKSLIEMMGGQIYVDSIEGSGTQVKFTLAKA